MTSITSANAVLVLSASDIFPVGQELGGWASDSSFMQDDVELVQAEMGVDGRLTGGFTPNPKNQTLKFQADSPSLEVMEIIRSTMEATRDIVWLNSVLTLKSTGESWTFTRGLLVRAPIAKSAQKVLQPQSFMITWQSVKRSII